MKIKKKVSKLINNVMNVFTGTGLAQKSNTADGEKSINPIISKTLREAGSESIVLLKNDGVLPLVGKKVSVFGRCQIDYFYVGYGSGGDVHPPYKVNLLDGLKNSDRIELNADLVKVYTEWRNKPDNLPDDGFWGNWPYCYEEMEVTEEIAKNASENSDVALIVLGRAAGEDRENKLIKGSYYLTDLEEEMIRNVTTYFNKVVLILDCGNIIDLSFVRNYGDKISAVLYAWQLGQESGNAVSDVLTGVVNPSGKLPDTIAINYEDYPSSKYFGNRKYNNYSEDIYVGYRYFETFKKDVLYPFGFGLTYTTFNVSDINFEYDKEKVKLGLNVKNIGNVPGKEVIQVYLRAKTKNINVSAMSLLSYKKTKELDANEEEHIEFEIDNYNMSSFDDSGVTGYSGSYVLDEGEYEILVGTSVKDVESAGSFTIDKTVEIVKHNHVMQIQEPFKILKPKFDGEKVLEELVPVTVNKVDLKNRILSGIEKEIPVNNEYITFNDVKEGKKTLDEFIGSLNYKELESLTRGAGCMNSKLGAEGNAGVYCGTKKSLIEKGVPPIVTTDGPAGVRIKKFVSLLPCGTALASSFNDELVERVYSLVSNEMKEHKTDVLLAPGMNIHRNPLCGRNFEYFSEDPVLAGKMASACVKGIQHNNKSACPKHFLCNNQETNRNKNDSRVSERALREIYLKPFEICVKESNPKTLMTSYNKVNGVWSHYNYDLVTEVLRNEFEYKGVVITDWWMQKSKSQEFNEIKDNAYRVRAGVNVLMPGNMTRIAVCYMYDNSLISGLKKQNGLTLSEVQQTAKVVLEQALILNK